MKTSELIGPALDWAVAKCEGAMMPVGNVLLIGCQLFIAVGNDTSDKMEFSPSIDWAQGGPIIEREGIYCGPHGKSLYVAWMGGDHFTQYGPTILIAGLRTYVASKLGYEIEIPEELK